MGALFNILMEDVRFREGMKACINCGTCTAICPAAEFYRYDPRELVDAVQRQDEASIEDLLRTDFIWYCGECMSCKTRCPRGNTPGLIITALRSLSQDLGYFTDSEKGRQQLAIKRTVGDWILDYGYCLYPENIRIEQHPEQGPVWEWESGHLPEVFARLGGNYKGEGPGIFRNVPEEALQEVRRIFEVTGGKERFDKIEEYSRKKAEEMGLDFDNTTENEYFKTIYSTDNNSHNR